MRIENEDHRGLGAKLVLIGKYLNIKTAADRPKRAKQKLLQQTSLLRLYYFHTVFSLVCGTWTSAESSIKPWFKPHQGEVDP
jgi:hypothetical protein